ncbi:hypothetical protein FHU35_17343 [Saccharopolyspora dendranthemae]|uniref:Glyoxalase-like domain-containing protein n=1 Tax=Saccharopolyspora dendranthemae TaxID=1181886 RepID=A0A561U000_9PSEU|nr:hypothetical protein FHU35_17343 [Saccharopolyspora dendranthemae]
MAAGRGFEICVDANEPDSLRPFWRAALGYVEQTTAEGVVDLVDPSGRGPTIWFQRVAEPKSVKNRVHLDVRVSREERGPLVDRLLGLGGREIRVEPGFTVLADPEGNELCLTR